MHGPQEIDLLASARLSRAKSRPGRLLATLRDRDHTTSALLGSLVVLSIPAILSSLAGAALYQIADLYFIGKLGPVATAAVGMTNQALRQIPFLMLFGACIGSQMMVARLVGTGQTDLADRAAGQALVVGAILALLVAGVGLFPEMLLSLVTSDPDAVIIASPYLRLSFLLMSGQIFTMLFSFILTGAGETTTPLMITLISSPVAVFAEYCLIFGNFGAPELGISGVAVGLACGSFVSLSLALWTLLTGRCRVKLRPVYLRPDRALLTRIVRVSWQPALQMVARTLIVVFFMALAGRLGTDVQAAYTIGLRVEMVAIMVAFPIANAAATLVGQNLAAGHVRRAWRSIFLAYGVEAVIMLGFTIVLLLRRHEIVAIFTETPEVAEIAAEYLLYSALGMTFYGLYFVSFRALQGAGDMSSPMLISLGTAILLGAPLAYYLSTQTDLGPTGMWIGGLVYSITNTALTAGYLARGRWTRQAG